ncbi:hypothetical protein D3C85_1075970 [compost metagenome]
MRQPARIGFEHGAQVRDAVFQHGQAINAHAEGETLILVRINAAVAQHVRVNHAAAEDLQPVVALVQGQLAARAVAANVHLGRGLGEGEVVRAEAGVDIVQFEEAGDEGFQRRLQMTHVDIAIDHQTLDLMEHRRVGGVRILTEGAAGRDDADRRLLAHHGAHLHRAGVGAQHLALARFRVGLEEECVVHFPRRVLGREVQGGEVVEVVLDVRAFGHGEAHFGEQGDHLVHDLHGRVHPALAPRTARKGQVDALCQQAGVQLGGLQLGLLGGDGGGDAVAQPVDDRPLLAAFVGAERAHAFQQGGDGAGLADGGDAHLFDRSDAFGRSDGVDQVEF